MALQSVVPSGFYLIGTIFLVRPDIYQEARICLAAGSQNENTEQAWWRWLPSFTSPRSLLPASVLQTHLPARSFKLLRSAATALPGFPLSCQCLDHKMLDVWHGSTSGSRTPPNQPVQSRTRKAPHVLPDLTVAQCRLAQHPNQRPPRTPSARRRQD